MVVVLFGLFSFNCLCESSYMNEMIKFRISQPSDKGGELEIQ